MSELHIDAGMDDDAVDEFVERRKAVMVAIDDRDACQKAHASDGLSYSQWVDLSETLKQRGECQRLCFACDKWTWPHERCGLFGV